MAFNAVPIEPTMSLHDIAAKLWVTDEDAYYNLRYYIEERDRLINSHSALVAEYGALRERFERSER